MSDKTEMVSGIQIYLRDPQVPRITTRNNSEYPISIKFEKIFSISLESAWQATELADRLRMAAKKIEKRNAKLLEEANEARLIDVPPPGE